MKNVSTKPGRWLWAIPIDYSEDGGFWKREGGLVVLGLRMLDVDARFVALGTPGERSDMPLINCTLEQMQQSAWWKQWGVDAVVLNAWALPFHEPIARAIKSAGLKLILIMDTEGIVSPHVWPLRYLLQSYFLLKDERRLIPPVGVLFKTGIRFVRARHAGIMRHLEHGDMIVLPSPLALQRYARYLSSMRRGDLNSRLRFIPYAAVKEMTYDPLIPKKHIIIAVGRWQTHQKNTPLLLRVLQRVLTEQPHYSARIIGSGAEVVKKLAQNLSADCRSRIDITGKVENAKLPALYGESRIFLSTSRYESFLIAAGEALCCGCSVVGDARIATMPYFAGSDSGTVSCNSSVDNFRDALTAEINAWQSGERNPTQISQTWQARLHPDRVAQALLKLLEEL